MTTTTEPPYRTITVAPIAGSLGAEISGVDLETGLTDESVAEIRRAWLEHLVVFFRGQDLTDEPFALDPGTEMKGVRVVLTQTASTVTGSVRDERGDAVLDTTVVVFPDDERQWAFQSRFIRTARPDTSGRFEIAGLPDHDGYRVVAVQGLENGQATDPQFLAQLRDSSERLALAAGETKTLDLRLRR
mgnify:CR=1 FL=1